LTANKKIIKNVSFLKIT